MNRSLIPILIVGAGGHAKVVAEILRELGTWRIVGMTDRDPTPRRIAGIDVLGTDEAVFARLRKDGVAHAIVAIGDNRRRQLLSERVRAEGFALATAISPAAHISASARIGAGVAIMAGAVVNAEATIGDCAIVNTRAGIDHDCVLGEAAHVAPGASLAGGVAVGARSVVGVGASVVQGVTIGADVIVGAGSAVVEDIPDGVTAVGVPARWLRPGAMRSVL